MDLNFQLTLRGDQMTARLANTLGFVFAAIMVLAIATSPNIFGQQEKVTSE